MTLVVQLQ